jgi:hypothetical protein
LGETAEQFAESTGAAGRVATAASAQVRAARA